MLQVVTPANSTDLVSLADACDEIGVDSTVTAIATRVAKLIARASSSATTYCNRTFGFATVIETFADTTLDLQEPLALSLFPIVAVSAVNVIDPQSVCDPITGLQTPVLIDPSRYTVDLDSGLLDLGDHIPLVERRSVSVSYSGGYLLPADTAPMAPAAQPKMLPDAVQQAVLDSIKSAYFQGGAGRARDPMVQVYSTTGAGSTTWFASGSASGGFGMLTPMATDTLELYRRANV